MSYIQLTFNSKMGPRHSLVGEIKKAVKTTKSVTIRSCTDGTKKTLFDLERIKYFTNLVLGIFSAARICVLIILHQLVRIKPFDLCLNYLRCESHYCIKLSATRSLLEFN